ncbi:MAG: class I SAM-dependent methyltransferase, partial [Acetobacterium sp.]|nr:class I SAM-dependent methyltransferase [Acetobacterium sp.]
MSHPIWSKVYAQKLELSELIDHVYSHKPYLMEIWESNPQKILEIGVGGGSTSIFLSYLGIETHAIDNDPGVINKSKENNDHLKGRLRIKEGDAFKLPYDDDTFDIICHQGFFEHFEDQEIRTLLKEQLRVAKRVIFSVPTKYYLISNMGERLLIKSKWAEILNNFNVIKSHYYGRPRNETFIKRILAA